MLWAFEGYDKNEWSRWKWLLSILVNSNRKKGSQKVRGDDFDPYSQRRTDDDVFEIADLRKIARGLKRQK